MYVAIIGIMLSYGVCGIILNLMFKFQKNTVKKMNRMLLYTNNNQLDVEWYIRSLLFTCKVKGINVLLILIDEGSTDETLKIAERLMRNYEMFVICYSLKQMEEHVFPFSGDRSLNILRISNSKKLHNIQVNSSV
jgi:hypothetical protein